MFHQQEVWMETWSLTIKCILTQKEYKEMVATQAICQIRKLNTNPHQLKTISSVKYQQEFMPEVIVLILQLEATCTKRRNKKPLHQTTSTHLVL